MTAALSDYDFRQRVSKEDIPEILRSISAELGLENLKEPMGKRIWSGDRFLVELICDNPSQVSTRVKFLRMVFIAFDGSAVWRRIAVKNGILESRNVLKKFAELKRVEVEDSDRAKQIKALASDREAERSRYEDLARKNSLPLGHKDWIYDRGGKFLHYGKISVSLDVAIQIQALIEGERS